MEKYFSSETEYFLYVLRCAVSGKMPETPAEEIDWGRFVSLAKKQEAYSLVAAVLPKGYLPDEQAQRLNNYTKSELVRLIAMKSELELIEDLLWQNGIDFMLLKGSRIREFYPKQSMRQMSDIDILYDEKRREALLEIMKGQGYKLISWSENSDDFSKKPYYTFEFHRQLFFDEFGFVPDFSFVWQNAEKDKENPCKYIMSDSDLYLHSVAHMYKHYVLGGFGVRFLADTYLILKKAPGLDFEYIANKLEEMKLTNFEKTVRELSLSLIDGKELTDEQLDFMTNVMSFGLYGDSSQGRAVQYEQFKKNNDGSNLMLRYTFSRLFPSSEYMHRTYSALDGKPYLLPYYYAQRLVTKTFSDGRKATREIKEIRQINKKDKQ